MSRLNLSRQLVNHYKSQTWEWNPTSVPVHHATGLVNEVDLESDKINNVLTVVISDWDHCQEVGERLPALSVVDEGRLRFGPGSNSGLQVIDGVFVDIFPSVTRFDIPIRSLQKTAVPSQDLMFRVSSQSLESCAAVDNWIVKLADVCDNKRARHIHRANIDFWIGTVGYTVLFQQSAQGKVPLVGVIVTKMSNMSKPLEE
jgi:hypothetical protein